LKKTVLIDIDHTLSDAAWRDQWLGQWDVYHSLADQDKPIQDMVDMVRALYATHFIPVGLTARPERWRKPTMEWLIRHDIHFEELLMRPDKDFRPTAEMKLDLVKNRYPNMKEEIAFIMDDREDVLALFKAEGVHCLLIYGAHIRHV